MPRASSLLGGPRSGGTGNERLSAIDAPARPAIMGGKSENQFRMPYRIGFRCSLVLRSGAAIHEKWIICNALNEAIRRTNDCQMIGGYIYLGKPRLNDPHPECHKFAARTFSKSDKSVHRPAHKTCRPTSKVF